MTWLIVVMQSVLRFLRLLLTSVKLRGNEAAARIRSWAPKPPAGGSFRSETQMLTRLPWPWHGISEQVVIGTYSIRNARQQHRQRAATSEEP